MAVKRSGESFEEERRDKMKISASYYENNNVELMKHVEMREKLREILFKECDVLSSPTVDDWWILYQVEKNLKNKKS